MRRKPGAMGIDGVIDNRGFRIFSEPTDLTEPEERSRRRRFFGGEVDGPSRQLARYVHRMTTTYMPEMRPMMIYRLDRFGRGGHHRPFNDLGFAGVEMDDYGTCPDGALTTIKQGVRIARRTTDC